MSENILYEVTIEGEIRTYFVIAKTIADATDRTRLSVGNNTSNFYVDEVAGTDCRRLSRLVL